MSADRHTVARILCRFIDNGGVFKLVFGPKAFIVVSDPVVVRHLLRENAMNYDKGVLAEILEPIMGKVGAGGVESLLDMDVSEREREGDVSVV